MIYRLIQTIGKVFGNFRELKVVAGGKGTRNPNLNAAFTNACATVV